MAKYKMPIAGSGTLGDPYRPKYYAEKAVNQAYDMATMTVTVELDLTEEEEAELLKNKDVQKA